MKKILFVPHTFNQKRANGDPSVWYRVHNLSKIFNNHGFKSEVLNYWNISEKKIDINCYSTIIFFRPVPGREFFELYEAAVAKGIKCVASYDDLIFDTGSFKSDSTLKSGASGVLVSQRYRDYANAFEVFDDFIVTTEALATEVKRLKPDSTVTVIDNYLPEEYLNYTEFLKRRASGKPKLIGYFAGGKSHIQDINYVSSALLSFCAAQDYKLLLPECFESEISTEIKGVSCFFKRVSYASLLNFYASVSITIAPLVIDENSNCKSAIKLYESLFSYKPLVSSGLKSLSSYIGYQSLCVAHALDEWEEKLHLAAELPVETIDHDRDRMLAHLIVQQKKEINSFWESV